MAYQQLTQAQRYLIFAFHEAGLSLRDIAKNIQVHYSWISRELRPNRQPDKLYDPCDTQHHRSDQGRRKAFKATKRLPCLTQ